MLFWITGDVLRLIAIVVAVIFGLSSLTVAILTFINTRRARGQAARLARTQTYLVFRERFRDIQQNLPAGYHERAYSTITPEESLKIERYWYNAFDEWYVTTQLHAGPIADLWTDIYEYAISSTLEYDMMRDWYCQNWRKKTTFGPHSTAFADAIEVAWAKTHPIGGPLC